MHSTEAEESDDSVDATQSRFELKEAIEQIEGLLFQRKYEEAYAIVSLAAQRTNYVNTQR